MKKLLTTYDLRRTAKCFAFLLLVVGCLLSVPFARAQVNVTTRTVATNVTLVWEASSYVPPFYKGKALMPDGGDARIVAFLPAGVGQAANMTYTWRLDGIVDGARSGIGKSIYEVRSDIFGGSPLIVVEVSDANGIVGAGALRVPLAEPRVLIYAEAPLGGVLFNVENPRLDGEELVMETYPLFFTAPSRDDIDISYRWRVNGSSVENPLGDSGRLVVRSDSAVGTTTIGVSITNGSRILENASGQTAVFLE